MFFLEGQAIRVFSLSNTTSFEILVDRHAKNVNM